MWVSELKKEKSLPKEFLDLIPDVCECGSELVISESLTGLHCPNPYCLSKVVKRADAMLKDLGVVGMGEKLLEKFFLYYNTRNPMAVFALEEGDVLFEGSSVEVASKIVKQLDERREMYLWQFLMVNNLPALQTTAKPLVEGYSTLKEFYEDFEFGGVDFVRERLGIADGSYIQASKISNSLNQYKDDLFQALRWVNIKELGGIQEIEICISQGVSGFKSKGEFVKALNEEFGDKYLFINNSSLTKSTKFFVWEGSRVTSKAKTAEKYGTPTFKGVDLINYFRNK